MPNGRSFGGAQFNTRDSLAGRLDLALAPHLRYSLTCMSGSSTSDKRALNILSELHAAEKELVGKAVVLTDGKAGTIDHVYLDDVHGLRISISGHEGRWPISTVKHIES